jgi:hypothetical protein
VRVPVREVFRSLYKSVDACQRRANFVAHSGQKFRFGAIGRLRLYVGLFGNLGGSLQLACLLIANSDIAHNPVKHCWPSTSAPFRNREVKGNDGAILAPPDHLATNPDDLGFSGFAVGSQTIVVCAPIGFRHQRADVLSNGFFDRVAEDRFRDPIKGLNSPVFVGHNDNIDLSIEIAR